MIIEKNYSCIFFTMYENAHVEFFLFFQKFFLNIGKLIKIWKIQKNTENTQKVITKKLTGQKPLFMF